MWGKRRETRGDYLRVDTETRETLGFPIVFKPGEKKKEARAADITAKESGGGLDPA